MLSLNTLPPLSSSTVKPPLPRSSSSALVFSHRRFRSPARVNFLQTGEQSQCQTKQDMCVEKTYLFLVSDAALMEKGALCFIGGCCSPVAVLAYAWAYWRTCEACSPSWSRSSANPRVVASSLGPSPMEWISRSNLSRIPGACCS